MKYLHWCHRDNNVWLFNQKALHCINKKRCLSWTFYCSNGDRGDSKSHHFDVHSVRELFFKTEWHFSFVFLLDFQVVEVFYDKNKTFYNWPTTVPLLKKRTSRGGFNFLPLDGWFFRFLWRYVVSKGGKNIAPSQKMCLIFDLFEKKPSPNWTKSPWKKVVSC